jgi:hypothetical protein
MLLYFVIVPKISVPALFLTSVHHLNPSLICPADSEYRATLSYYAFYNSMFMNLCRPNCCIAASTAVIVVYQDKNIL